MSPHGRVLALLGGTAVLVAAAMRYAVTGRRAQVFGRSVYRGPGRRQSLALTFDDGPSPGTLALAEYLAGQGVKATFFLCGKNVLRHPEIAQAIAAAGHELGNHGYSHARLTPRLGWQLNLLSPESVYTEFARSQEIIQQCTGVRTQLLRAPYGLRWRGLGRTQARLGLTGVHWTVIGHDWEWSAERVAQHVLRNTCPGGIICLHDGRETRVQPDISVTLAAVRQIVSFLKRSGYRFETVSQILHQDLAATSSVADVALREQL